MAIGIPPESLQFDERGNPVSVRYGDVYASRDGAVAQAQHVFLGGNDLPARWAGRRQFVIVETGFGLGTNFLAAWHAWRDDARRPQRLHFVSVERHPVGARDLARLPADSLHALRAQLAARWPLLLAGVHRLEFEAGRVVLTLGLGDAADLLPDLVAGADAFFLDGFAPARNPEMWQPQIIRALARLARADATLATYTCARDVREALAQQGFAVQLRPGFGSKREMTVARYAPGWTRRRIEPPAPYDGERSAIVIGAGLAGAATAHALARRGWAVQLLERGTDVAAGASGLPAGLLHPALSVDHNLASRLSQAGFLRSRSFLEALPHDGEAPVWSGCGVLQQAGAGHDDGADAQALRDLLARAAFPAEYARWVEPREAAALCGLAPRRGGIWFGGAGVVSARRWCRAMIDGGLSGATGHIALRTNRDVQRIGFADGAWCVTAADGASCTAPVLVLANALAMPALAGGRGAPLRAVWGQISLFDAPVLAGLRAGICGDGYLIPAGPDRAAVGASYEESGRLSTAAAHRENRARWAAALEGPSPAEPAGRFAGARCVSADRLPLVGPIADEAAVLGDAVRMAGARLAELPRRAGLWTVSALGSRGLTLALLSAELTASRIEGEPWPVERALADAVDPARFLLRRVRRGGPGE